MIKITSSAFSQNATIPQKYTCTGENINPPLSIEGVPENTKSLALIIDDPDASRGTFTHWIIFNIDPQTTEIKENSFPKDAILGKNDSGNLKYRGPCPPSGTHRYFFTIYALDTNLNFSQPPDIKEINKAMEGHIIDSSQIMAKYSK